MRTMVKVSIPVEAGNAQIKSGALPKVVEGALKELKPEAAYFFPENGRRSMLLFIDLADPSQIPLVAERFFVGLNADVTMTPVMNAQDLQKGIELAMKNLSQVPAGVA